MMRFVFISVILFLTPTIVAQDSINTLIDRLNSTERETTVEPRRVPARQEETTYTRPLPFSPFAETYQYNVQRLYESLPKTENTENIPGAIALVNAELKNILAGDKSWSHRQGTQTTYWSGYNFTPIGNHNIEVRNLNTDHYFWCVYGKVQLFIRPTWQSHVPATKTVENYFIVLHFKRGNARPHIDYFTIGGAIITNNTSTLNAISKEATALLATANREAYKIVNSKKEWTIHGRAVDGQFDSYRNGRVTLLRNNARAPFNVTDFSYENQMLLRGYIDHQGISIRDVPNSRR